MYGWATPLLPRLTAPDSEIPMTSEQASWMVSMPELANLFTPIPAAMLADHIGRKPVILMSAPLFAIGWAIILYFRTYVALVVARLIQGGGTGIVLSVVPVYVGEIASTEYRGAITSLFFIISWFGYLFEYSTGPYMSMTNYTLLTLATTVVFFLMFLFQPETPYFYLMKNKHDAAQKSLEWLRCLPEEPIKEEMDRMTVTVKEDMLKKTSWREVVATPTDRKALYILLFVGGLRILCGVVTVMTYATNIFLETSNLSISADIITIILGVVLVVGSSISFFIIDVVGRRPLLITSCIASSVCLGIATVFYYLQSNTSVDVSSYNLVAPVAILVFSGVAVLGFNPINTAYTSELFNSKTRSLASSINVVLSTTCVYVLLNVYQYFVDTFGAYFNFMLFTIVCVIGTVISYIYMPETKNKTFEQIRKDISVEKYQE